MASASNLGTVMFSTCTRGVSSALETDMLGDDVFAWGRNVDVRGGKVSTRPGFVWRADLPGGIVNGFSYFGVMGGMIVLSVGGRLFKVRVNASAISSEEVELDFINSPRQRRAWMCQTVETLVIQNGLDAPIFYDGSVARRSNMRTEVPRGECMAYGNGRLWVAVNGNELVAGDIRMRDKGSELRFTETNWLIGGGSFSFPRGISALGFIPSVGGGDVGALLVGGVDYTESVRADITSRDSWESVPSFVAVALRDIGMASQWCVAAVNRDLFWRDSDGGVRSLSSAMNDESGAGMMPLSEDVSRVTRHEGRGLSGFESAVYFDNRLLLTASPFIMAEDGNVGFRDLIALDFAQLGSIQAGKSAPAWCGEWDGLHGIVGILSGKFLGVDRCFVIVRNRDGGNELWEVASSSGVTGSAGAHGRGDSNRDGAEVRTLCCVETPLVNFGAPNKLKRIDRLDVMLSGMDGDVSFEAWWRSDNNERWHKCDSAKAGAVTSDASTVAPHVWKNLKRQGRSAWRSFTAPEGVDGLRQLASQTGNGFQVRLAWRGKCRVERFLLRAALLDDPYVAGRESWVEESVEHDVSGNDIFYEIDGDSSHWDLGGPLTR